MERIPVSSVALAGNELKYLKECVETKWVSSEGEFVKKFEQEFAKYCGTRHAVSVSNGTHALHLALLCHGIKAGDEVIVPDLTFVATANAVAYIGAKPVCADIDRETWNIGPEKIKPLISKKTKAIIPVHLYGLPCEMDEINEIAEKQGLAVIEDSAESIGAEYKGKKAGNLGHSAIFSLYGNKVITTGEGGMITTNDAGIAEKANYLKNHAMSKERRYFHTELGFNYRMTNLQAAFGLAQLEGLDGFLMDRKKIAETYGELFSKTKGITLPLEKPYLKNTFWTYSVLIEKEFGISSAELQKKLGEKGIDTRPFFAPISKMPYFKSLGFKCPVSCDVSERGISLPTFSGLTGEQIERVIAEIKNSAK
ncbi:MAG: DegT/DnrJ/EryC1/StrS family aminotransferase [Candidatus Diapherotrites archaeon]